MVASSSNDNSNNNNNGNNNKNTSNSSSSAAVVTVDGQDQGRRKLSTNTLTFSYTGSVQQWVVPTNVATIKIDAYGAAGGDFNDGKGGLGGYISVSNIAASSFVGKTLFIYVGQAGAYNTAPGLGGGGGRVSGDPYEYTSGGGATDLRTSLSDLSSRCVFSCVCVCVFMCVYENVFGGREVEEEEEEWVCEF